MSGPISVASSSGSPTRMPSTRSSSASMKRSSAEASTRIRERAQQSWPALPNTAPGAAAAAASRSASANTRLGDLPPSSSVTRLMACGGARGDPAADLGRAGEGDLGHVGVLDQALPQVEPGPATTLTTPSGRPASSAIRSNSSAVSGVSSAGLSTDGVARGEARAELPGGDGEREVPGRDQRDHAERLAEGHGHAAGDRDRVAEQPLDRARVVAEDVHHHAHLAARVADRLAGVARLELARAPRGAPPARRRAGAAAARGRRGRRARQAGKAALARATAASVSSTPARGSSASTRSVAGSSTVSAHARPRAAGSRSAAYARASSTSAATIGEVSSASGCHCTPSAKRLPGSSSASGRSSIVAQPVTASPSPIRSTPWWWCDLVGCSVDAGHLRRERALGQAHVVVGVVEAPERRAGGRRARGRRAGAGRASRRARRS